MRKTDSIIYHRSLPFWMHYSSNQSYHRVKDVALWKLFIQINRVITIRIWTEKCFLFYRFHSSFGSCFRSVESTNGMLLTKHSRAFPKKTNRFSSLAIYWFFRPITPWLHNQHCNLIECMTYAMIICHLPNHPQVSQNRYWQLDLNVLWECFGNQKSTSRCKMRLTMNLLQLLSFAKITSRMLSH